MLKTQSRVLSAILMAMVLALGAAIQSGDAYADNGYGKQKVVYHINYDDPKLQAGALRNIQNHINAVGKDNLEVRVVLHGNGLALRALMALAFAVDQHHRMQLRRIFDGGGPRGPQSAVSRQDELVA